MQLNNIKLFICCLFFAPLAAVFAQKRDSLEQVLEGGNLTSQEELSTLEMLYQETPEEDSLSGVYLRRLLELTRKLDDKDKFGSWAVAFFHSQSPGVQSVEEKIKFLKEAASQEEKIQDSRVKGNVYLKLGGAFFNLSRFDSAIYYYQESISRFGPGDSIFVADAEFFAGQAYDYQGDLLNAMEKYQQARDIYELLDDKDYVNYVTGGMAILFSRFGIYEEADKIRETLIEAYRESNESGEIGIQLYNRAEDLRKQNRYDEQLATLLQIEEMRPLEPERPYFDLMLTIAFANYFGKKEDIQQQLSYYQKAKELIPSVPQFLENNPSWLYTEALLMRNQRKTEEANQLAIAYLKKVKPTNDMDHIIRGMEIVAQTYEDLGRTKEAAATWKNLNSFKDSLNSANKTTTFAYYQTLYETEKKEREILDKTRELEEVSLKSEARTRLFLFVIGGLLIVGGGGFLTKSLQQAKKEKKLQERFSHELLISQEEERKRISKDLHDGLGQSLLLIKNRVALSRDENTGEMLDTAISELRAIARSLHPMQLEKLGLSKATEQLLDQIDRETELFVSAEIDQLDDSLTKVQELHLYRILQECLNNILKHAEATAIRVCLGQKENEIQLKIEDNGKGFDFSERYHDFQSLGLKTLKERTAAIQGIMKVSSEKGKGSQFTFTVYA
ncbi:sensor histidine kinase [Algoriphagus taiwanensis]|uniref:Histidine kinase domain-containing protein n=1 Tax=Algoriphagus taiwanensis TaxID=1445656 RepID=A0ABQ6Q1F2_9BACT|nr:hypothetical protein Ataiwa_22710 [Algoriphagus taiwanensis]